MVRLSLLIFIPLFLFNICLGMDPGTQPNPDDPVPATPKPRPESCPPLAEKPTGAIRIATWNIEWLNDQLDTGNVARSQSDYDRLRFYGQCLDADIVAVQEVDGVAAAERVFDPADYLFHFAQGGGAQKVGFVYRKSLQARGFTVTALPDYQELTLDGSLRPGAIIELAAAGKTLTLMNIHLKASCADNDIPLFESDRRDCQRLAQQVPILETWIDELAGQDDPVIVLGDFNRRFEVPDQFWPEIDDGSPRNADLTRTTENQQGTCWTGRRQRTFIDHIVYDQLAGQLVLVDTRWQHRYLEEHQAFEDVLSDHCPLSVDIQF